MIRVNFDMNYCSHLADIDFDRLKVPAQRAYGFVYFIISTGAPFCWCDLFIFKRFPFRRWVFRVLRSNTPWAERAFRR